MRNIAQLLIFACLPTLGLATNYYVTQSGTGSGTSSTSPWSVANFNASSLPTGGDTVYFSGTFTSSIAPKSGGTGNGTGRLVLDFSGAVLNSASPRINGGGANYVTYVGGGRWTQGSSGVDSVYTPGCTVGAISGGQSCLSFNSVTTHDVTVQGFQCTSSAIDSYSSFIYGVGASALLVVDNNMVNLSNLFFGDGLGTHDITFRNNYFKGAVNITDQSDIIAIGDGYNITIEGNKLIMRAPGAVSGRHNDVIQFYRGGGGSQGNPYGIVIRYNWLEQDVTSGSGDISFTMLEAIGDSGGTPALKAYSNVIVGTSTDTNANNGFGGGDSTSHTIYCYNNTYIRLAGPANAFGWNGAGALYCRNNVCYSPASSWDGSAFNMSAGAPWDYNYFYNWQAPSSAMAGTHGSRSINPSFTSEASRNYSLSSSSPLKGAGDSTLGAEFSQGIATTATWPAPTLVSRGSSWDIGAYQSGASAVPPSGATTSISVH